MIEWQDMKDWYEPYCLVCMPNSFSNDEKDKVCNKCLIKIRQDKIDEILNDL